MSSTSAALAEGQQEQIGKELMGLSHSAMPAFRPATTVDLKAIQRWLRNERRRTGEGFYCNWGVIKSIFAEGGLFVVDAAGEPVAFLANGGTRHEIAEVHPYRRGMDYGRIIADAMVEQSTAWGLSVIEILCAPETSAKFWTRMGFTVCPQRRCLNGLYAYREIPRRLALGAGPRVPFAVRFYDERAHHRSAPPFRTYQGDGEMQADRRLDLPDRAVCYAPEIVALPDCYVEIEVSGERLFLDKTKREGAKRLGMSVDRGGIPYIEAINTVGV